MSRRVVLIGATGVFGSRLAAMMVGIQEIELVLAARGRDALQHLRTDLLKTQPAALIDVEVIDRRAPDALAALRPWLVVDAAGPFQGSDYGVAEAAISAGAHYLDLADGRSFVAGLPGALDQKARAAGVLAVTGASSTPALSHAALHAIANGWSRLDDVCVAISPGARAPRGLAVVQAILSYVGRPVRLFRDGAWGQAPGWSGPHRLAMPGLGRRWASICETPDLDLLPKRFSIQRSALFMAGLELAPMHLGLWLLSWLVRLRLVRSLTPLAAPLRAAAGMLAPFGSDRGGMIVKAAGMDEEGRPIRSCWSLCAEANAGPSTPAAPAAALIRALAAGSVATPGAYAAAGLLSLDAITAELAGLPITTLRQEGHPDSLSLYRRLLGRGFAALPASVQAVHGELRPMTFTGRAVARAGCHPLARVLRRVLGLPPTGKSDVEVTITPDRLGETWRRRFGKASFASRLVDVGDLSVFEERFGPLRFVFDLRVAARGVAWRLRGWSALGMPLPLMLAPRMIAKAEDDQGRYRFRVVVAHPFTGLLFAYRGWLVAPDFAHVSGLVANDPQRPCETGSGCPR